MVGRRQSVDDDPRRQSSQSLDSEIGRSLIRKEGLTRLQKLARLFATAMVFFVYFSRGHMFSVVGPTLLGLRRAVDTTIDGITWIFGARGLGLILGCGLLILVKDRWRSVMFGIHFVAAGVAIGLSPLCRSLAVILVAFAINGFGMGFVESGAAYLLTKMWGDNSPVPLAAANVGFCLGATVSPLIALPFLSDRVKKSPYSVNHHKFAVVASYNTTLDDQGENVRCVYFIIMGVACTAAIGLAGSSVLVENCGPITAEKTSDREPIITGGRSRVLVLCLMVFFVFLLLGFELSFYGMLPSYIIAGLGGTEQDGTLMETYFWGLNTILSLLGVFCYNYLTPSTVMLINLVSMTVGTFVLIGRPVSWLNLWIGTTLFAMGMGSAYGGVFIWSDHYLKLSHKLSALLVAGGQLGAVVVPVITGPLFSRQASALIEILLTLILLCDVVFIAVEIVAYPYTSIQRPLLLGLRKNHKRVAYHDIDRMQDS